MYKHELIRRIAGDDLYLANVRLIYDRLADIIKQDLLDGKIVSFMGIFRMQIVDDNRKKFYNPKTNTQIERPNHKRLSVQVCLRFRRFINGYRDHIVKLGGKRAEKEISQE